MFLFSRITAFAVLVIFLGVASNGPAAEGPGLTVPYEASLQGVTDPVLKELLISVSDTFSLQASPPASLNLLQRRVNSDLPRLLRALRSQGFFKAEAKSRLEQATKPMRVIFTINTGPAFSFSHVEIRLSSQTEGRLLKLPGAEEIGIGKNQRYRAADVLDAQKRLLTILGKNGLPFPRVTDRRVVADHAGNTVSVTYFIDPGPRAVFGEAQVKGLVSVDKKFVIQNLVWQAGDPFDASLLTSARTRLIQTGLFSVVDIARGRVDPEGRLSMLVSVKERSHRTLRIGVGYQTDTGPEVKFGWEHRNILGAGENLETSLSMNEIQRSFDAGFRKPGFLAASQSLILAASLCDEETEAFKSEALESSVLIERHLTKTASAGLGLRYRATIVKRLDDEKRFGLISVPIYMNLNNTDDLLDPSRGGKLNVLLASFADTRGNSVGFTKLQTTYSRYFRLVESKRLIFAARTSLGVINGVSRDDVPGSELFFAGGGGSVRGYHYQTAGDMDGDNPLGGLSLFEVSGELRSKLTSRFGLVAFFDGGRAYASATDLEEDLLWGTGLGLRYYTPVGPLRMDVAFPLNKREGVDAAYQIYVSLGQSF
ncbi:MAG: BamA/TamA family outer membrane protein [Thermodesulfobacteriota bacterium]|nr:BamA/TamA family outer membrane protein [Thermodesulfobacteriota bacterium]